VRRPLVQPAPVVACLTLAIALGCRDSSRNLGTPQGKLTEMEVKELPPLGDSSDGLDDGRLNVAPPRGWFRQPRSSKYVVKFTADRRESCPAVIVTAEDYEPIHDMTADGVAEFVRQVAADLKKSGKADALDDPVSPLVRGKIAGATYQTRSRDAEQMLDRRYIETVAAGRKYTVELRTKQGTVRKFWPHLLAVVEGMEFVKEGTGAKPPESKPEPPPGPEPTPDP